MKHLLEVIAKALVDQPDKVTVTEKETADADKLESIEDSLEESLVEIQSLFEKSDKLDLPED